MYCKSCGSELEKDALFCSVCGESTDDMHNRGRNAKPKRKGKYSKKKKSFAPKVFGILIAVLIIVGAVILGSAIFSDGMNAEVEKLIDLVRNGYLGEYTDFTVEEILDSCYGMLYEQEEWDGGITDSDQMIVQVKYYDEGYEEDATTIQFTMLNEECFKITAFVDPLNPIEKATDLLATMNYNYLLTYVGENREVVGDLTAEDEWISRLDQISGSSVQYGASADYRGNRANICEVDGQTQLGVSVAMLLDNYGLLDMSYYWGAEIDQITATEPHETETTLPVIEQSEAQEYDADTMLISVLKGEQTFIMSDTYEYLTIFDITKVGEVEFDEPLMPYAFAIIDLDRDGTQEVVVDFSNYGERFVYRYHDGNVYGYGFGFRAMKRISTDGVCEGSSGAAYTDLYRLIFDGDKATTQVLTEGEADGMYENWIEIEWYDYTEENIDTIFTGGTIEKYVLDYITQSTGDIINELGTNYIYSNGLEGSKLFYYGDNPNVQFGFVPVDWADPVITGDEAISVIILSGDAKINRYLSADMSKSQIDAVAWSSPGVQNVVSENSYSAMSGSIYRYEIETPDARIVYIWYLDDGDSTDFAASEIIISPK